MLLFFNLFIFNLIFNRLLINTLLIRDYNIASENLLNFQNDSKKIGINVSNSYLIVLEGTPALGILRYNK